MSGMAEIMDAMADQIRGVIDDVTDVAVQVEPRMVLNPSPPTIDIYPGDSARFTESAAFDDDGGYLFTVRARVHTADQDAGQNLLLAFMDDEDPLCLGLALMVDNTFGGHAASADIRDVSGYRLYEHPSGEGAYLGFQFTAMVIPAKS